MKKLKDFIFEQILSEGITIRWTYDRVVWKWLDKNKNLPCIGGPMTQSGLSALLKNAFARYKKIKTPNGPGWTWSDKSPFAFIFTGNDSLYIISFRRTTGSDYEVDYAYKMEGEDYQQQIVNDEMRRLFIDRDTKKKDLVETNKIIRELNDFYDDLKKGIFTKPATAETVKVTPSGVPSTFQEIKAWLDSMSFKDSGQYSDLNSDFKEFEKGPDRSYIYGDLNTKVGRRLYVLIDGYVFYFPISRGKDQKIDFGLTIEDISKSNRLTNQSGDATDYITVSLEKAFEMLSKLVK